MCIHVCVVHCVAMLQVTTHTGDRRGWVRGGRGAVPVAWGGGPSRPRTGPSSAGGAPGHSGRWSDTRGAPCPSSASRGTSARRKRCCFAFRSLGFVGPEGNAGGHCQGGCVPRRTGGRGLSGEAGRGPLPGTRAPAQGEEAELLPPPRHLETRPPPCWEEAQAGPAGVGGPEARTPPAGCQAPAKARHCFLTREGRQRPCLSPFQGARLRDAIRVWAAPGTPTPGPS